MPGHARPCYAEACAGESGVFVLTSVGHEVACVRAARGIIVLCCFYSSRRSVVCVGVSKTWTSVLLLVLSAVAAAGIFVVAIAVAVVLVFVIGCCVVLFLRRSCASLSASRRRKHSLLFCSPVLLCYIFLTCVWPCRLLALRQRTDSHTA